MEEKPSRLIPVFELVLCLTQAVDLVSPQVADHHKRTAVIALGLGRQMKLDEAELRDLVIAAALHDVGGLTRSDRLAALDFEFQDPYGHAVMSYLLLRSFPAFEMPSQIVRFHHVPWQNGAGSIFCGLPVPLTSHLLHLADRLAVLIDPGSEVLEQVEGILARIRAQSGERFVPEQVKALEDLSTKEAFWLDAVYMHHLEALGRRMKWQELEINAQGFLGITDLFRRIIDFRSRFTSSHSAGVAATAECMARLCGFSPADCWLIHVAGLLHDLGKLAVPAEILEKPGKLTREEYDVIRRHTYYTFHILEPLRILDVVRVWGAYHHERMDGQGYPFHLDENELPLGSRIVSVADIFTALTEDRPYRDGLPGEKALEILADASEHHRVDSQVVALLKDHLEEVNECRSVAQQDARGEYQQFLALLHTLTGTGENG